MLTAPAIAMTATAAITGPRLLHRGVVPSVRWNACNAHGPVRLASESYSARMQPLIMRPAGNVVCPDWRVWSDKPVVQRVA
jgi:hypothetical protein